MCTTPGTAFTVTGLAAATGYSLTVTARDAAGNTSAQSNGVSVTTDPAPGGNLALHKSIAATRSPSRSPRQTPRYLRLNFTANTGWPAGQLSELEVYSA